MVSLIQYGIGSLEDLPRVVELKIAMFEESKHKHYLHPKAASIILKDYKRLYATNKARHFVAFLEDKIVAVAGAFLKSEMPFRYFSHDTYGFIGDVYTEPSFRNQGIATRLSTDALAWLKSKNVEMVRLFATNSGHPIYKKLGFQPSDEMVLHFET
jgi:GNAT superfamily N-acetyltransferase